MIGAECFPFILLQLKTKGAGIRVRRNGPASVCSTRRDKFCVSVCVCVCVCVRERERESVCVCVCERERERESRSFRYEPADEETTPSRTWCFLLGPPVRQPGEWGREGVRK